MKNHHQTLQQLLNQHANPEVAQAAQHHSAEVIAFIEAHLSDMPRATLRYAIEKLTPEQRKRLMHH